jgi:hypothetical protein
MGEPPSTAGAVQVKRTEVRLMTAATRFVGVPGPIENVVTEFEGAESAPVPMELVAATRNS